MFSLHIYQGTSTYLVHIDPESVDVNASVGIEEREELVVPVFLNIGVEPVREGSDTYKEANPS